MWELQLAPRTSLRAEPSFASSWSRNLKRRLCLNPVTSSLWSHHSANFWTSHFIVCFFLSSWFFIFDCKHQLIDKLMVKTEPIVPRNCILATSSACSTKTKRSYLIHEQSFLSTPKMSKEKKGSTCRVPKDMLKIKFFFQALGLHYPQ